MTPIDDLMLYEAMADALEYHGKQRRKGGDIPYMSHIFAVAGLVMENGGTLDEVIAALLHDAPEDAGGLSTLANIRKRYGTNVADIVEECSDTFDDPKPPWKPRKEAYIAHLEVASESALRVCLADKLHNGRMILSELQSLGQSTWDRFNAPKEDQIWYYENVSRTLMRRLPCPQAVDLLLVVKEIRMLS